MSELFDQAERLSIRNNLNDQLFVEAGAGTGKTTELVSRVVQIVQEGNALITEIVAITFTEAAASELKERVREALDKVASSQAPNLRAARCMAAVASIDEAPIGTIHSFAQRILQTHPIDSGLPLAFEVCDRIQARVAFGQRWRRFVRSTFASPMPLAPDLDALLRTTIALGGEIRHLKSLAEQMERRWHLVSVSGLITDKPDIDEALLRRLIEMLQGAEKLTESCTDDQDRMLRRVTDEVFPWGRNLSRAFEGRDENLSLELLTASPKLSLRIGAKKNWSGSSLDDVREVIGTVDELRGQLLEPFRTWVLNGVVETVGHFVVETATQRRLDGRIEFHDLLVLARNLLVKSEVARKDLKNRFKHVLVDEFQDTDPLQFELIGLLTEDSTQLFTVGDPKQSIYRFRNADLDQYFAARPLGPKSGHSSELIGLTTNFRTLPNIVSWVNQAFRPLLSFIDEKDWLDLDAGRQTKGMGQGSVTLLGGVIKAKSAELREVESDQLVELITTAKGNWEVQDRDSVRPARLSDVAVLVPTRVFLPALERAFRRAGVPYRIESRSLVWATQELRDLLSVLKTIDDPTDQVSLIAALRSPLFACSDVDLLNWKQSGGLWDYRVESPVESSISKAYAVLGELHASRWHYSVVDLITEIVVKREAFELAFEQKRQRESWNRIRFLIDQARMWTDEGGVSLHGFIRWANEQMQEGADVVESVVPEADDDAVRVMTMHASKGLEFPIACVMGLSATSQKMDPSRVLWAESGMEVRLGVKAKKWQTTGFDRADLIDAEKEQDEQARLLYVAATRARDHLIVSMFRKQAKTDRSLAARFAPCVEGVESHSPAVVDVSPVDLIHTENRRSSSTVESHFEAIARGSSLGSISATTVTRRIAGDDRLLPVQTAYSSDDFESQLAEKLAFGRAVHAVLENIDFTNPVNLHELVSKAVGDENISHRTQDAIISIRNAIESRPVREAVESSRWWREVYVAGRVDDTVVEGYIDLLYERPDGSLVVVDYKTDELLDESTPKSLMDHYRWQLLTYAAVLQQNLNRKVSEVALLFISPLSDGAVVKSEYEVGELTDELLKRVAVLVNQVN